MNSEIRLASSAVRGVMAGNIAVSSSRSDQPAHAGELGEMVVGVAEQRVDDADAFEIVPDLVLHGHADAAVQLDRVLADETPGAADLHPGRQRGEPRDVLPGRPFRHRAAHHHVLDLVGGDAGALDCVLDHVAAEHGTMGYVEGAAKALADRGAGGRDDDGVGHQWLPEVVTSVDRPAPSGAAVRPPACLRRSSAISSFFDSLPTLVRGSASRISSAAGISWRPSLLARTARNGSSVSGGAPRRSVTKALAASPR